MTERESELSENYMTSGGETDITMPTLIPHLIYRGCDNTYWTHYQGIGLRQLVAVNYNLHTIEAVWSEHGPLETYRLSADPRTSPTPYTDENGVTLNLGTFAAMVEKVVALEQQVDALGTALGQLIVTPRDILDEHNDRIGTLEHHRQEHDRQYTDITVDVSSLNNRMLDGMLRLRDVEARLNQLEIARGDQSQTNMNLANRITVLENTLRDRD
jgi:hypothetical protein